MNNKLCSKKNLPGFGKINIYVRIVCKYQNVLSELKISPLVAEIQNYRIK
jgi:hypothetical protein